VPTIWGTSIAQTLRIPCIGAFLQPVTSTGDFPSPLLPSGLRLGRTYNRFTYWLMSQAVHIPWRGVINRWRKRSLGLKPLPFFYPSFEKMDLIVYGFSEKVVPYPRDWPPGHSITGYWSFKTEDYRPSNELQTFLKTGAAPFYFGFGSPGMHEPRALIDLIIQTVIKTNARAVLALPSNMDLSIQNMDIFVLQENVPHHWLFPQMAGIVHHGGAGTTAEALKAGVPSLITPLAVDQFFWGEHVHSLGVSPRAIPQRELTPENLAKALEEMKDEKMKDRARKLGETLHVEDGVANAAGVIKKFIETRAG
jgi:sterol 3beta-glucosyltransferase